MYNNNLVNSFSSPEGVGPTVTGKFFNKRTGETVLVRDSFIDGDNMVVLLSDGRQIGMNEFSRDYFQDLGTADDSNYNYNEQPTMPIENTTSDTSNVDPNLLYAGIEPATDIYTNVTDESYEPVEKVNKEFENIDKVFSKLKSKPKIRIDMTWEKFPTNEVNMLIQYFDVKKEDISEYILNKYITDDAIIEAITERIKDFLK